MNKAIFFKEWIKTRGLFFITLLVSLCFAGYVMMRINRVITFKGADHLWAILLSRDTVFIELLQYLPLIIGALFASSQFIPEMTQKRLKLTLHLPYPQQRMILLMLLAGSLANQHRLSVASRFLVDLPATTYRLRNGRTHIADSGSVVYLRLYRLPDDSVDMPRTDVEAAHRQSADRRRYRANLFPARQTGSL